MRGKRRRWARDYAVGRARRLLLRRGRPRAQMALVLLLTGCAGFLLSYALLHAGVTSMSLRYPVVIFLAHGVFLMLLRGWLALQRARRPGSLGDELGPDLLDAFDAYDVLEAGAGARGPGCVGPGEAVGAGGSWPEAAGGDAPSGGGRSLGGFDLPVDGDEGGLVFVAVLALAAAIVAGLLASVYVV